MQLGRPLLLVPPEVRWLDLRSVLVAWKDRPEARRAIVDALPLLRKAKDVAVAQIAEGGDSSETASARAKDVVAWLSRHGIFAVRARSRCERRRAGPTGRDGIGRWRRPRGGGSLRPLAIPRMGARRRDAPPDGAVAALRPAVALAHRRSARPHAQNGLISASFR